VSLAGIGLGALWTGLLLEETHGRVVPLLPVVLLAAYGGAILGVSRARRSGGEGASLVPRVRLARWLPARSVSFRSADQAQAWFERQRNGLLLPGIVACWMLLAFLPVSNPVDSLVFLQVNLLYFVPLIAPLVGTVLGKPAVWSRSFQLPASLATRPVTTGQLLTAKLRMLARTVLAAYLLLAVATPLWVTLTGVTQYVARYADAFLRCTPQMRLHMLSPLMVKAESYGPLAESLGLGDVALVPLGLFALLGFCWLQLAGNIWVSLTGRVWVFLAAGFFYLALTPQQLALWSVVRSQGGETYQRFLEMLPALCWCLLAVKLSCAAWAFWSARRRGLLTARAIATLVGLWGLIAGCWLVLLWVYFDGLNVPFRHLLLGVALCLPLLRVAVAPLALAWNRHR
jgi:hypothetical protein